MKQINIIKKLLFAIALVIGTVSCEDFLDRPDKANYTLSDFYQTDEQCFQAVNPLYTVPWFDFFRGWLGVGDIQSGNYFNTGETGAGFWLLTPSNGSVDAVLASMSASLWAVNARVNTVLENIDLYAGGGTTETGRNTAKGEALVWKAMAYFYMVRIFGAVPIVHNNTELLGTGEYNTLYRAKVENVYDYIVMTLKQAIDWLPEKAHQQGRIDKYSAYGLLAKVYLTKSGYGRTGDRNQDDLDNAKEYARKVVRESGRILTPEYADIFRGSHNTDDESLLAWRWVAAADNYWTAFNDLQSDLGMGGFTDAASPWGDWVGPSLDLQEAFGETINPTNTTPAGAFSPNRQNTDKRRKATMMMYGDIYENFWRDHPTIAGADGAQVTFPNGFDYTKFCEQVLGTFNSSTGANCVKHLVGRNADHAAEMGGPIINRGSSLATHILRLADVYLVYAEAILGNNTSTTDAEALYAFNEVHKRAGYTSEKTTITFDDVFKERRLELAFEGDFWYDFVRLSYYNPADALARLNAQNRKNYTGLSDYYKDKGWASWGTTWPKADGDKVLPRIDTDVPDGKPYTADKFTMPFPETDLQMNPNLMKEPIDYDLSQYTY
jgi:hypothetical protein